MPRPSPEQIEQASAFLIEHFSRRGADYALCVEIEAITRGISVPALTEARKRLGFIMRKDRFASHTCIIIPWLWIMPSAGEGLHRAARIAPPSS